MAIQTDIHFWSAVLVEASLGVGYLVTGDDQATLDQRRRTVALTELEGFGSGFRSTRLSGQTELEVGRLAEDTLGFGGVLHARQLNHDAVGALTLDDTQLVDAVTYRGQVLLDGVFTDFRQLGRGHRQTQHRLTVEVGRNNVEIVEVLADQRTGLFAGCFISEAQLNGTAQLRQTAIAQLLFTQKALDVAFVDFQARVEGFVHVHFQQEVHTTGQVQTQLHRVRSEVAQPLRGGLCQVQRDDVVITQCLAHDVLGRQLVFSLGQANQTALAALCQRGSLDVDPGFLERSAHAIQISLIDLQCSACTADLNGRVIRIKIGSGINQTDRQHRQDQNVFPQRIFVQHHAARL